MPEQRKRADTGSPRKDPHPLNFFLLRCLPLGSLKRRRGKSLARGARSFALKLFFFPFLYQQVFSSFDITPTSLFGCLRNLHLRPSTALYVRGRIPSPRRPCAPLQIFTCPCLLYLRLRLKSEAFPSHQTPNLPSFLGGQGYAVTDSRFAPAPSGSRVRGTQVDNQGVFLTRRARRPSLCLPVRTAFPACSVNSPTRSCMRVTSKSTEPIGRPFPARLHRP